MGLVLAILPILILICMGFLCGRLKLLDQSATNILVRLLFYIVMPITLFIDIAQLPVSQLLQWNYLAAYFSSSCLMITLTILISHFLLKRKRADLVLNAMATTHANTAYLAIPIFLLLFHTLNPVAGIILVQAVFVFAIIFSLEAYTKQLQQQPKWLLIISVFWKTPILIGIILGLAISLSHIILPSFLVTTFTIVQNSAPFLALFALGVSLTSPISKITQAEYYEVTFLVLFKSILHPVVAFLVGYFIFCLPHYWLECLVLMATMPTAKNLFVFAQQYQAGVKRANIVVVATTTLSLITINIVLAMF